MEELIDHLAIQLYDEWRAPRIRPDGTYEPKIKEVGGKSYDIANLDYKDLPEKFKFENEETAKVVYKQIFQHLEKGGKLDNAFLHAASDEVHRQWLKLE